MFKFRIDETIRSEKMGDLLQYSFSDTFYLGGEIFHQAADKRDDDGSGFNVGGSVPLIDSFQLLYSAGRGLTNTSSNKFSYYVAFCLAF